MKKHPMRRWRESHDKTVTLSDLGAQIGVGCSLLSEIENGKKKPSLDLACRLSRLTGISVFTFNDWTGETV